MGAIEEKIRELPKKEALKLLQESGYLVKTIVYPAVFTELNDGYSVVFPDFPGILCWEKTFYKAKKSAENMLTLKISRMQKNKEVLPLPSKFKGLKTDIVNFQIVEYVNIMIYNKK